MYPYISWNVPYSQYCVLNSVVQLVSLVAGCLVRTLYTVKTGLFSISFPQTVPLQITDLLNKYLGKTVFVY